MIIDLVKTVIGVLPLEYEFIYYIVATISSFALISILFLPFKMALSFFNKRGGY